MTMDYSPWVKREIWLFELMHTIKPFNDLSRWIVIVSTDTDNTGRVPTAQVIPRYHDNGLIQIGEMVGRRRKSTSTKWARTFLNKKL